MKKTKTLLIYAENHKGVLERIMMLIRQKRYNLEQITASDTNRRGIKQITLTFSEVDKKFEQVMRQINKIIEVIEVREVIEGEYFEQEISFVKIKTPKKLRSFNKIIEEKEIDLIETTDEYMILRIVSEVERVRELLEEIKKEFEIIEFLESGPIAMMK